MMDNEPIGNNSWRKYKRQEIEQNFPSLAQTGFRITSQDTIDYNCVAWAVEGDQDNWWWPDQAEDAYWPEGAPRQESLEAFTEAFRLYGYELCKEAGWEEGFWKIAIFTNPQGVPTHVARLKSEGLWTSKLGSDEDIEHKIDGFADSPYGNIACYMKRRMSS